MEALNILVGKVGSFAWGPIMIIFLVGTGVVLTLGTRIVQFRKLFIAFKLLFSKEHTGEGDITPFQALMTSLSATIGTGNIAGGGHGHRRGRSGCDILDVGHRRDRGINEIRRSRAGRQVSDHQRKGGSNPAVPCTISNTA